MTLQERFRILFPEPRRGLMAEISRKTGRTPPSVYAWFKGETGSIDRRDAEIIVAQFAPGFNPAWVSDGVGPRMLAKSGNLYASENMPSAMPTPTMLPLVSWVAAGDWATVSDPYQPGVAEEFFPSVDARARSPRAYALRVRGVSMFDPASKLSFSDGDIIFVNPDLEARHGSLVIVRLDNEEEATFKRLIIEGDKRMLEALNPAWPNRIMAINGSATLCGVVVGKYQPMPL